MRIKFEKGLTPERIADNFVEYIYENNLIIGAVNMYIQTYDDEMIAEKFDNKEYISCSPTEKAKEEYLNYAARVRRGKFKTVVNK